MERCQRIQIGDKLLAVNGKPVDVHTVRKALGGKENSMTVLQVGLHIVGLNFMRFLHFVA